MIDFKYEFQGMTPSEWTEDFLQEQLGPLAAWAPGGSEMKLKASRYSEGFEGKLLIHSSGGAFVVAHKAADLEKLVHGLKKKMKTKLHKWKQTTQSRNNGHPYRYAS